MRVGTLYAVLRLETGAFDAAMANSESKMARFFGLVKAGAVIAASALAVIVSGSVFAAAKFDQHMTQALAIMEGVTADLRVALEQAARDVAKTTTFSANEAADAYYYLAAAGFTAAESVKLLPVVARFAQASLIDMAEATDRLVSIMTAFGLRTGDALAQAETLTRVSDALVKGATLSLGTMEELGTALVTGTAQAFRLVGKEMEEALAVLMVYANQGIKGAAAGTALSIVMRELQTKAIKNAEAFGEFGISVFDAAGEMRNMADIIADFERAMVGMSDEEKKNLLLKLGLTDRSNKFLLSLIGTSDAIRQYEKELREAGGYTERVAQAQLGSFIAQLTIMWHKIIDMGITIGNVLLPHLTEVVKAIGNWFDANNELAGQITEKVVEAVRRLVLFLENRVFPILAKIGDVIAAVVHQFRMWAVRLEGVTGAFSPIDRMLSAFTMGLYDLLNFLEDNALGLAFLVVARSIVLGLSMIAAHPVAAAILLIITAVGLLHQAWNTNVGGIQEKWAEFVDWFEKNALPRIQEVFAWFDENVRPILEGAFKWFVEEAVPAIMDAVKWLFEEGFPALGRAISDFYEQNKDAFDRLARFLTEDLGPDVAAGIMGFGDWLIENGPTIASIIGQLLELLGGLFTIMFNIASYVIPLLWNGLMTILAPLSLVGEAVGILLTVIDESFKEIKRIVETVSAAIGEAVRIAGEIWNTTLAEIEKKVDIFVAAWEDAGQLIEDIWAELQLWAQTAGNIIEGVINDIAYAIDAVARAIQKAIDLINGFIAAKAKVAGDVKVYTPPLPAPKPPTTYTAPKLPTMATGVRNFAGGFAMVGERGPELVNLPRGADVYSTDETREMMRRGLLGARESHVHLNVQGLIEAKNEYDVLRQLRRAAKFMPLDVMSEMRPD